CALPPVAPVSVANCCGYSACSFSRYWASSSGTSPDRGAVKHDMLLSIGALTLKKTVTLLALVEPASMIPIFLASVEGLEIDEKTRFARTVGISVTLALMVAAFFGMPLFSLLGVSIGAMQVGGGIIVLLLAIAMVLGKETSFKGAPEDTAVLK